MNNSNLSNKKRYNVNTVKQALSNSIDDLDKEISNVSNIIKGGGEFNPKILNEKYQQVTKNLSDYISVIVPINALQDEASKRLLKEYTQHTKLIVRNLLDIISGINGLAKENNLEKVNEFSNDANARIKIIKSTICKLQLKYIEPNFNKALHGLHKAAKEVFNEPGNREQAVKAFEDQYQSCSSLLTQYGGEINKLLEGYINKGNLQKEIRSCIKPVVDGLRGIKEGIDQFSKNKNELGSKATPEIVQKSKFKLQKRVKEVKKCFKALKAQVHSVFDKSHKENKITHKNNQSSDNKQEPNTHTAEITKEKIPAKHQNSNKQGSDTKEETQHNTQKKSVILSEANDIVQEMLRSVQDMENSSKNCSTKESQRTGKINENNSARTRNCNFNSLGRSDSYRQAIEKWEQASGKGRGM